MVRLPATVLNEHQVRVPKDNPFQQRARLLQALWREGRDYPGGEPGLSSAGSRLAKTFAREAKSNLMTKAARDAVDTEVAAVKGGSKQLISENRLWTNLLSSQPLAFNLFAELHADLGLATRVLQRLWPARVAKVTRVRFEHSPERGSNKYIGDHTAFDVFFEHATPAGGRAFIGLDVKYHEGLNDPTADHRPRYDEVTAATACSRPEGLPTLRRKPLEQIWRDHLLAGSMHLYEPDGWESGLYVFLYPQDNEACRRAVEMYREVLADGHTFSVITLETMVDAIEKETAAPWNREVRDRYLSWDKVDAAVAASSAG